MRCPTLFAAVAKRVVCNTAFSVARRGAGTTDEPIRRCPQRGKAGLPVQGEMRVFRTSSQAHLRRGLSLQASWPARPMSTNPTKQHTEQQPRVTGSLYRSADFFAVGLERALPELYSPPDVPSFSPPSRKGWAATKVRTKSLQEHAKTKWPPRKNRRRP